MATRREFVMGAAAATLPRLIGTGIGGPAAAAEAVKTTDGNWDQGQVQHLLPTVSHDRFLIKASFASPLQAAPELAVGANRVRGQINAAAGDFWQFDVSGLSPATPYQLSLTGAGGRALCEPWSLSTFPAPDATPERLRLMIYTCGGGHDALNQGLPEGKISVLPSALRRRLLQRGLSFKPDALIANGDQIYWDLRAPLSIKRTPEALRARIEANLATQHQPELSAIHLVRELSDLTSAMPRFVTAFVEAQMNA